MNIKNIVIKIIVASIGLIICGLGVGIFLFSKLGVDPASVFQTGLSNVLNISYGTASALSNIIILIIVFIIDKSYINISSFLAIFLIGYTADFMSNLLKTFIISEPSLVVRIFMILIGCIIIAIGIATYIRANLGVGAIDMVSEVISDKLKIQYRVVRVTTDVLFVVVGYILGGVAGVGTLFAAFLVGPIVQFVRPYVYKITDKVLIDASIND